MNLVFLGPPGSGKGTQAVRVARQLGVTHLSTGDVLREAVKNGTALGKQAEGYMKRGELVPDDLIIGLIENKITGGALDNGFILDGFPRTMEQARSLKTMFEKNKIRLDKAILLKVSDQEIIKRIAGRAAAEGRADDTEDVVRNRLDVYNKQTKPIEVFYREESILTEIQGEDTMENVFQKVMSALK
ncbi:MAG: adenylate kinase [candidate division Zixibacteria bacterium]|jgi:adenylate kinase|nr:adenylate kinase [candidate division Zixibacteria bacterium]